ncbi:MAG: hypothetical protein RLY71_1599 [Pseudomonadota bacterium]
MLAGCSSVGLVYGNGSTLSFWWLDHYLDFSPAQARQVRAAMDQWFVWHRSERMPQDLVLLERARREVQGDLSAAQICAWIPRAQQWRDAALAPLAGPLAAIASTLSEAQLAHLENRLADKNADWSDEHLQSDPRERQQAVLERVVKNAERLYGSLDRSQTRWLAGRLATSSGNPELALAERRGRQQQLLETLRDLGRPDTVNAPAQLLQALASLSEPADETGRQQRSAFLAERCQITAELHNRTSPKQRQHAAETLAGWQRDLASYMAAPRQAAPQPPASDASSGTAPPASAPAGKAVTAAYWPAPRAAAP